MSAEGMDRLRAGQAAGGRVLTARGLRTRERLVAAARDVFAACSFAEARLADITTAAGVSAGTFYTYFDDKEAIFREVAAEVFRELSTAPTSSSEREPDAELVVEGLVVAIADATRRYFTACLRNERLIRSMEQLAVSDDRKRYELAVHRQLPDGPGTQHFYYEPWTRSNHLLRLNLSPPDSALSQAIARGPHTSVSVVRQREWWGNNTVDPTNVDSLYVSTTRASQPTQGPLDMVNAATAPYTASTIAMITFDVGVDQASDVSQLHSLGPFLSGVDVYMPATDPPDGVNRFEHHQRRTTAAQVINTPNWSSAARHGMTVTFRDWAQATPEPDSDLSQRIDVEMDANAGVLVVSVDPNDRQVTMTPLELSSGGDRWTSNGALRPVRVSDTRVSRPGWNVSGQVGAFVSDIDDFGSNHLGWTPAVTAQAPTTNATAGSPVASSDLPGQGLSTSRTLANAAPGSGRGTAELGAGLGLDLPAHLGEPGTYSALLTLTAI